jgi:hypothetical protein
VQVLERLEERATQKRNTWHDTRSGRIRFATEAEKIAHLDDTWTKWRLAVADLNAYRENPPQSSRSPKQAEIMMIVIAN